MLKITLDSFTDEQYVEIGKQFVRENLENINKDVILELKPRKKWCKGLRYEHKKEEENVT